MLSLSHSLIILIDLDLPIPLSWKTTILEAVTFHLGINPWDAVGFILEY